MALVREYLGYNRFGLRYVTTKEMRLRKERVLKHDFSPQKDIQQSPQDGKAIEWFCAFLALTIACPKAQKPILKNLRIFKKAVKEKSAKTR